MTIEIAGFRAPDYIFLLVAYPALLVFAVVAWFVTRVRPKGRNLLLQFRVLGFSFQVKNGHINRQESIGEINESTETD